MVVVEVVFVVCDSLQDRKHWSVWRAPNDDERVCLHFRHSIACTNLTPVSLLSGASTRSVCICLSCGVVDAAVTAPGRLAEAMMRRSVELQVMCDTAERHACACIDECVV